MEPDIANSTDLSNLFSNHQVHQQWPQFTHPVWAKFHRTELQTHLKIVMNVEVAHHRLATATPNVLGAETAGTGMVVEAVAKDETVDEMNQEVMTVDPVRNTMIIIDHHRILRILQMHNHHEGTCIRVAVEEEEEAVEDRMVGAMRIGLRGMFELK